MEAIAAFEAWPFQNDALRNLHQQISNGQIPHAILLVGNQGDTASLTEYLAKLLVCTAPEAPCGHCEACLAEGNHPDVIRAELSDTGTVKTAQIEEIQERITWKSHTGGHVVYIVPAVDNMTGVAANRLLKTLEEPNPSVLAILTATNQRKVLPTILSRCFIYPVESQEQAFPWLDMLPSQFGVAGSSLEGPFAASLKAVVQWTEMLFLRKEAPLLLADALQEAAAESGVEGFLWLLAASLRDAAHLHAGEHEHLVFQNHVTELERQTKGVTIHQLIAAVEIVMQAKLRLRSHVAANLNLEQMCIRLREVIPIV